MKIWNVNVENWGWRSDPRPPPLSVPSQAGEGIFWQSLRSPMSLSNFRFFGSLFGPRCLCQNFATAAGALVLVAQWLAAPGSLLRGLCWNQRFRPSCACVPPLVHEYCKIKKTEKKILTQKQQNATKLNKTRTDLPSSKATKFECKTNKTQQNWTKPRRKYGDPNYPCGLPLRDK